MQEPAPPLRRLNYVPVGTIYTHETLGNESLRDIQNRTVYDPNYAGFEENFDWRRYVNVTCINPQLRAQVEASLEQYSLTSEGQHILRQSLAMQVFRETGRVLTGEELQTSEAFRRRVEIRDFEFPHGQRRIARNGSNFDSSNGRLTLDRNEINGLEYRTIDGGYANFTVQDVVFHELAHSADALLTANNQDVFYRTHGNARALNEVTRENRALIRAHVPAAQLPDARELLSDAPIEYPAMRAATAFLQQYYGATEQQIRYSLDMTREDKDGGTHFYNGMTVAPSPTPTVSTPALTTPSLTGR